MVQGVLQEVLRRSDGEPVHVLALGAHADDIELGCAATLLYLKQKLGAVIHYVVFCRHFRQRADRPEIKREDEMRSASELLGCDSIDFSNEIDTEFPDRWREIQRHVEEICRVHEAEHDNRPFDLVLAPRLDDNHQDHVVLAQAAAREAPYHARSLWHYEIKQTGRGGFEPNIFVNVNIDAAQGLWGSEVETEYDAFLQCWGYPQCDDTESTAWKCVKAEDTLAHRKVFLLHKCMESQRSKAFMHPELLLGVMQRRGMQASPQTTYAEAFVGRLTL